MIDDKSGAVAQLTARDLQVLRQVSASLTSADAAADLGTTMEEVAETLAKIRRVLGVESTAAAVRIVHAAGE